MNSIFIIGEIVLLVLVVVFFAVIAAMDRSDRPPK